MLISGCWLKLFLLPGLFYYLLSSSSPVNLIILLLACPLVASFTVKQTGKSHPLSLQLLLSRAHIPSKCTLLWYIILLNYRLYLDLPLCCTFSKTEQFGMAMSSMESQTRLAGDKLSLATCVTRNSVSTSACFPIGKHGDIIISPSYTCQD